MNQQIQKRKSPGIRWWLKWRPLAVQPTVTPAFRCLIFTEHYVPWWAWPLELVYRLFYGKELIRKP